MNNDSITNDLLDSYPGFYPQGTKKRTFRVLMNIPGLGQEYLRSHPLENGLEVWNNAAFWLNNSGRGLRIPLQGPERLTDRYKLPPYAKPEDVAKLIPPATELTERLVIEVEKRLPPVGVQVSAVTMPSAFVK